jgi:hypothetical protein
MPTMGSSLVVAIVAIAAPSTIETSRGATLPSAHKSDSHAFTGIRQFFPGRNNAT